MQLKRAVITGMGALTPIGNDLESYWHSLLAGRSGAGPIESFDASAFKSRFACALHKFDATDYLDKREVRRLDPFVQYALVVADEAVADARLDLEKVDRDRVGVIWASALGGYQTIEEQIRGYSPDEAPRFSPFYIPKVLIDASSGTIAMRLSVRGVNFNTVSACASANGALISALDNIRLGRADVVITGGSEAAITPSVVGGFSALKALSTRNDDPQAASRPFDVERDGVVIGEGAGALVIEELEHARRRGAPIYAELAGGGLSADAHHATAPHPQGLGAVLSMRRGLAEAGVDVEEIDYVNAHATSTPSGDIGEVFAIRQILGERLNQVNIGATKSMTGHLLGAAGAVEAIIAVMTIHTGMIPPTINTRTPDPALPQDVNLTLGEAVSRVVNVAVNNSFGFGGHNATTVFRKLA